MSEREELDVTGIDLIKLTQEVYKHSEPLGKGFMHFIPGDELSEADAAQFVATTSDDRFALNLDYIRGRACKFGVFKKDRRISFFNVILGTKLFCIENTWRDHSFDEVKELVERVRSD